MAIIEVKDLTRTFKVPKLKPGILGKAKGLFHREYTYIHAVNHVNFSIEQGEFIGYIGPNGAGKSTTIKILSGILWPTEGKVTVHGRDPHRKRMDNCFDIGAVFGWRSILTTGLGWYLPIIDSFKLLQKIYEVPEKTFRENLEMIGEYLGLADLWDKPLRILSQGQWVRASVAAAFVHNPKIVYLDEPTIAMDLIVKEKVREFLRVLNKEKKTTIILTTHDLQDVEMLCPRVLVIDKGKIIYDGELQKLKDRYIKSRVIHFTMKNPIPASDKIDIDIPESNIEVIEKDNLSLKIKFDRDNTSAVDIIQRVFSRYSVQDVAIEEPKIENVIKKVYLRK